MGSYLLDIFKQHINKNEIQIVFELGSRDLLDAIDLVNYYDCNLYSFECNPDGIELCEKNLLLLKYNNNKIYNKINFIPKAISLTNDYIKFYPFDINKYNNIGASSMFKIDFSNRDINDPDYNRENPQKEILVEGIRLDNFCNNKIINKIDLLCMDLQGYELNALKSLGSLIKNVKYIITEASTNSTYINGCNFFDLQNYLKENNFEYVCSNKFGYTLPYENFKFCEFDALFINRSFNNL